MPEVFTGLLVIVLFLLVTVPECLGRRERQRRCSSAQTVAGRHAR
jgi:hypothetical protein